MPLSPTPGRRSDEAVEPGQSINSSVEALLEQTSLVTPQGIKEAAQRLDGVAVRTDLEISDYLSKESGANVFIKREDQQCARSYKLRGAYNAMSKLDDGDRQAGVACASAGNHAQGFAYACSQMGIDGTIYMPETTPEQKIEAVKHYGGDFVELKLEGDTFDAAYSASLSFSQERGSHYIHPFDNPHVIEGQGTVIAEALEQFESGEQIDYVVLPVGGGGLAAGTVTYLREVSPHTKIIGAEPAGAESMAMAIAHGGPIELPMEGFNKFVDGAAVRRVGGLSFSICRDGFDHLLTVGNEELCYNLHQFHSRAGVTLEPAGALSIAALRKLNGLIQGKNVVCIASGGNMGMERMAEVVKMSHEYMKRDRRHRFVVEMPERDGALESFLTHIRGVRGLAMGIFSLSYERAEGESSSPMEVGFELKDAADSQRLIELMDELPGGFKYTKKNGVDTD